MWVKLRRGGKSAPLPLLPSKQTFASAIDTSVKGHSRHFAAQKISEPFRHRSTVKSFTDLRFEA